MGSIQEGIDAFEVIGGHAEFIEGVDAGAFVEESQHGAFAVGGGDGADAEVDFARADIDRTSSVLGEAFFGDIHPSHHFNSGDDHGQDVCVQREHVVQDAIDAVADIDFLLEGMDMDVRSSQLQGSKENIVDQTDDRGSIDHVEEVFGGSDLSDEFLDAMAEADLVSLDGDTVNAA